MCGIAGVFLRDPEAKADLDAMLDTMLDEIEHRGGDATGYVAFGDEGVVEWQKASCDARDFSKYRRRVPTGTRSILAHTRWATQGLPAFIENNHPLKRGSFFVIHNGHVSNDNKLFELAGRTRFGQVDSEAIPARFASLGKLTAAKQVMSEIEGPAAIAAVDERKPNELILARGYSSPLFVLQTKRYVLWGSTQATVKVAYEQHIGRLPRKAKIEQVKQGTILHFVDGSVKRSKFKAYRPAPLPATKLPNITLPYQESTPSVSQFHWDRDEELLPCDECGSEVPWNLIEYRWDDDRLYTEQFCSDCAVLADYSGRKAASLEEAWVEVNEAILSDLDAE